MDPITDTLKKHFDNEPAAAARIVDMGGELALNLVLAIAILVVTFWLAGFLSRLIRESMAKVSAKHAFDTTLSNFIGSLVRYGVVIVGLIAVFGQLGVQTTSILAVLGAASLAIGLALQGALSNVAAGVMLLILRPYRIGDLVELGSRRGRVRNLDLFVTEMTAPDGLRLTVPNSKVLGDMIVNYTASGRRRMELKFGVGYTDDLDEALELMLACAEADTRVLKDPAPWAKVTALGDNSVTVTLRAWTSAADIGDAEVDMIKKIKETFDAHGISFPYPHQVGLTLKEAGETPPEAPRSGKPAAAPKRAVGKVGSKGGKEGVDSESTSV